MNSAMLLARRFGVRVEIADLGDWGDAELRSEYDPSGPTIRINRRLLETMSSTQAGAFIALAVGHELYHHREAIGEIAKLHSNAQRERAADSYAHEMVMAL